MLLKNLWGAVSILVTVGIPVQASAENWIYVTSDRNGSLMLLDTDSIKRDGQYTLAWEMMDAEHDKTVKYRTRKTKIKYDCNNDMYTYLMTLTYSANGEVIDSVVFEYQHQKWSYVVPGTVGATQFNAVCAQVRK